MIPSDHHPALAHCRSMIFPDHAINCELVVRVCSVATHSPANNDEQIPVRVPQAPSEDITVSLFATTPPLGYSVADPLAQAAAQASTILILFVPSVSPVADPLAQATPQILPVVDKVPDEIAQILPRLYPVPEEIAQIAVNIAISVA